MLPMTLGGWTAQVHLLCSGWFHRGRALAKMMQFQNLRESQPNSSSKKRKGW
jgi:hypothetical protein